MSADALRAATDQAQASWDQAVRRIVARYGADLARIDDPAQAAAQLRRLLSRETAAAYSQGAATVDAIVRAAGAPATPTATVAGTAPVELARTVARDWRAAREHPDPATARAAAVRRIVDVALSDAHDDGMTAAMAASPAVIGWRRVARPGCCLACLALADGTIHPVNEPLARHPHDRCIAEPVLAGVNDQDPGRPGPQERLDALTDEQLAEQLVGRGGEAKARLLRTGLIRLDQLVSTAPRRGRPVIYETPLQAFPDALARLELIGPEGALRRRPPTDGDSLLGAARSPALGADVAIWDSRRWHWQDERERPDLTVDQVAAIIASPDYVIADRKHPRTRSVHVRMNPDGRGAITVVVDHGPDGPPWVVTAIPQRKIQRWIREAPRRWSP